MLTTNYAGLPYLVDNFGATYTDGGIGTTANSGGSTHTKGTPVSLISGELVTKDVFGMGILFSGSNAPNSIRRHLVDILIDPNGGTSWTPLIKDLFVNNASLIFGGYNYFFPIYIKSGTSIGFQHQCNLATTALRCAVVLYGPPSRSDTYKVGHKVDSLGIIIGTTSGTTITPGTSVLGAWTLIGSTTFDTFWFQWGGIGYNESAFVANSVLGDVGYGSGADSNTNICLRGCAQFYTAAEQAGKSAMGLNIPYKEVPSLSNIYCRSTCSATPETTPTTTVYALG